MATDRTKRRWAIAAAIGAVAVVATASLTATVYDRSTPGETQTAPVSTAAPVAIAASTGLSDTEITDILFMREEEKLARDVYLTLNEIWDTPIFENIARAEETHMAAVYGLVETYGLDDPVGDNPVGVFVDPSLQQMYDDLVERGAASFAAALDVGALIEEVDIEDLIDSIDATKSSDVMVVWQKLLSGSENHLRAYASRLAALGIDRTPTVLDAATYDDILAQATAPAQGRSDFGARGRGRTGGGRNS
jgi:hypothetical protein